MQPWIYPLFAAGITGACALMAAVIGRGGKRHPSNSHGTVGPQGISIYQHYHDDRRRKRSAGSRALLVLLLALVVGFLGTAAVLQVRSSPSRSRAVSDVHAGRGGEIARTTPPTARLAIKAELQTFMNSYYEATAHGVRDPQAWGRYWSFPARWYNANPQNVNELIRVLPNAKGPASDRCDVGAARVVGVNFTTNGLDVLTKIPWTVSTTGTSGEITTRYSVMQISGVPHFTLVGVRDDPQGQHACVP